MAVFRGAIVLLLVLAAVSFALFAGTGQQRYKRFGLVVLKWTLIAAFGFFAVLIIERVFWI
jgi:hypothetical protein